MKWPVRLFHKYKGLEGPERPLGSAHPDGPAGATPGGKVRMGEEAGGPWTSRPHVCMKHVL